MALSIKDDHTDRLVRQNAKLKGMSYTRAIRTAVSDAIEREGPRVDDNFAERIRKAQEAVAAYPRLDNRTADEIIGYDENGLPA